MKTIITIMKSKQITKPITGVDGLVYAFAGRYDTKEDARAASLVLVIKNVYEHVYYTKIMENGIIYYDVRTSCRKI